MQRIHMDKDDYDNYVLNNPDAPIFDEHDNYRFHSDFDISMTRDQIGLAIEEYGVSLRADDAN